MVCNMYSHVSCVDMISIRTQNHGLFHGNQVKEASIIMLFWVTCSQVRPPGRCRLLQYEGGGCSGCCGEKGPRTDKMIAQYVPMARSATVVVHTSLDMFEEAEISFGTRPSVALASLTGHEQKVGRLWLIVAHFGAGRDKQLNLDLACPALSPCDSWIWLS